VNHGPVPIYFVQCHSVTAFPSFEGLVDKEAQSISIYVWYVEGPLVGVGVAGRVLESL
jgi:hypothetical protein